MRSMKLVEEGGEVPRTDYHMHTEYSDGEQRMDECIKKAERMNLSEIAITDHVWNSSDWVDEYIDKIRNLAKESEISVKIGLEAKAIDTDGRVDVSERDASKVDFVMGAFHQYRPEADEKFRDIKNLESSKAAKLEAEVTIAMLENPRVDIIAHPGRTYHKFCDNASEEFPSGLIRKMVRKAKEENKILEYNSKLPEKQRMKLLEIYLEENLSFSMGSDAHVTSRVGDIPYQQIAQRLE